jgi:hypothetical protein
MLTTGLDAEGLEHKPAGLVEEPDNRSKYDKEGVKRPGHREGGLLGILERYSLRRELPDHHVEPGNDGEGQRYRCAVARKWAHPIRQRGCYRLKEGAQSWLADPTESKTGHGYAQLAGRDVGVHSTDGPAQQTGRAMPLYCELFDAGAADCDECEFGRNEKAISSDEDQDGEQSSRDL